MKYTFKDMLTAEIYESAKVLFVFGKYNMFNNLVSDEVKARCISTDTIEGSIGVEEEFGISASDSSDISSSVDFNTFMDVNGVANVSGKWFCKVELQTLTKKQKEKLAKYIKAPSDTGILVVVSTEWKDYREYLKNKVLAYSKVCHIIELSFPSKDIVKALIKQMFEERGIEIQSSAIDMFMTKMSVAYDEYEVVINKIKDVHGSGVLESKDLKVYMKGIDHYILDDFILELTKPMVSDKTNSKKVLKIMMTLESEVGAKTLVYNLLNIINECIEFRILINTGMIPINLNYFFNEVINRIGKDTKYGKMKEYTFRRKALLASQTSLRDWEYMKLILFNAIKNVRISDDEMDKKCQKALYELCTRTVITPDRINNIIGIDNVLHKQLYNINKIKYDEQALNNIINEKILANL